MLEGIESRGGDATGFAAMFDDGELRVEKAAVKSDKFIKKKCFKELSKGMPRSLIMHTRKKTKGAPTNNNNNHPIWVKDEGIALVHNGSIVNDDDVFENLDMPRIAEVDSEVLAQIFVKEGDFKKGLETIGESCVGTVAFAMLNSKYPDHLYLGRNTNPIELLFDTDRDILFFSSLSTSVKKAHQIEKEVRRWRGFALPNIARLEQPTMKRDSAFVIGPKGIKEVFEFDTQYTNPFAKPAPWAGWRERWAAGPLVVPSGNPDVEKYRKWVGFDSGRSTGRCDFCLQPQLELRYIPLAKICMCRKCYATTEIKPEEEVTMVKCDRCFGMHDETTSTEHVVYDVDKDKSEKHVLCATCWSHIQHNHCMLCGTYKGIADKFQEGVGYLCTSCNAGQYGA